MSDTRANRIMGDFARALMCALAIEQLAHAQSIDISFNPGSGPNRDPIVLARHADGRIVIAGYFSQFNGAMRSELAVLHPDGTLDPSFDPMEGPNGIVRWVLPQPDGKLIIAGDFTAVNSLPRQFITRLRGDGSVDIGFPSVTFDGSLRAAIAQSDGRILLAGFFSQINGTNRSNLARVNTNGTLDLSFSVPGGVVGTVNGLARLFSGKVLVFGSFASIGGFTKSLLARLHVDGTVDTNFALPFVNGSEVTAAVEQSDGKLLICGEFTSIDGYSRIRVARLNSDGTLDLSFYTPFGTDIRPQVATACPDGKLLIGGSFSFVSGISQNYLARLNGNGAFDSTFRPRLNGHTVDFQVEVDARILVCGGFSAVNGTNINRIVRLTSGKLFPPESSLLSARLYPAVFLEGATGTTYRVEYVNSLTNAGMWTPLTNLTLPTTPYLLLDTTWTNSRQRFYRALTLP